MDGSGKIITDAQQQTSVSGLYAAGDVTAGLCQIAVATGEGATAASHIHSQLASVPAECQTIALPQRPVQSGEVVERR
jgi:thioredoxin reductase